MGITSTTASLMQNSVITDRIEEEKYINAFICISAKTGAVFF